MRTTLLLHKQKGMPPGQDDERSLASGGACRYIAFCTALIWLVHPIQTQSVSYIVQRMNSMAAMFYLLAFFFYIKARLSETRKGSISLYTACFLAGLLAIGSKENAATLPFFIFLYDWYFFRELNMQWLQSRLAVVAVLLFLLGLLVLVYIGGNPLDTILAGYKGRDFTLGQRVLTQFRVIMLYLGLIVWPHPSRLNLEHEVALSYGLFTPVSTLFSIIFILAAVGYALYIARSDRLVSFWILWFFGNLFIESSIIPLELVFEHRTYLPSMLLILAFVWLAARLIRPKAVKIAGLCVLVAVFSVWTHQRNVVWADAVTLWADCVKKSPGKARPYSNLGQALAERGRAPEGMRYLEVALRIEPDYAVAHNNMGTILERRGRRKEAIQYYREAVSLEPDFHNAHYNLGVALHRQGSIAEAAKHYQEALRINPYHALAHNNLGVTLQSRGRIAEAVEHYSRALEIQPNYADAQKNLDRAAKKSESMPAQTKP